MDEGPLGEVEERLGLSGRYAITGTGAVDPKALVSEEDILSFEQGEHRWTLTVSGPSVNVDGSGQEEQHCFDLLGTRSSKFGRMVVRGNRYERG